MQLVNSVSKADGTARGGLSTVLGTSPEEHHHPGHFPMVRGRGGEEARIEILKEEVPQAKWQETLGWLPDIIAQMLS